MDDPQPPGDDLAVEALLRDHLPGPPPVGDLSPWDFLQRWPQDVRQRRVWPVVSRLLVDKDETVRARALQFVRDWSDGAATTTPRLIEVAEQHPSLFADQVVDGQPLKDLLADSLGVLAIRRDGPRIAAILRKMASSGPIDGGAATILARHDPSFVIAQAQRWGQRASQWLEDAALPMALYRRDMLLPFLQAARQLDAAARERILGSVETVIKRNDHEAGLIAQTNGLPAPTKPAPSAADCRRAIGL